jgi:nitrogen-specific signal transduction histidine kinase/ActR/RegA family two-component response regulator
VIRDVTREREVQRRARLQERLAAVGQLAAGIAHDFNNIMAVISLYSQMSLRRPNLPPRVEEWLRTILGQARRASDLIQQILDFGRRAILERHPLDLVPLLKEQVKLLERTLPENVRIELAYEPAEYVVHADPTRIQQMMMNLSLNSRDAMPEGGDLRIELGRLRIDRWGRGSARPVQEMEAGEWIRIAVSDTGAGISPEVLPHIFEPFYTTKSPVGTGLGLSQVFGIVGQHGGHIFADSKVGEGTVFTIYLPAMPTERPDALAQEPEAVPEGAGQTILVVEDDPYTREALVESLASLNYQVLAADNGQEALRVCEEEGDQIALVLSDVVMPEMGGIALFQALRSCAPDIKLVAVSGHPLEEAQDLQSAGVMAWLKKPVGLEELATVLHQALESEPE